MIASPPLTSPDADLQDFPFMPLHVARLRDSDLAAEGHPEGCWYAVLLWAASWHQLPAGSLPDNDAVLARLCGLGRDMRSFRRRKADALRGFTLCSDGRLYHPVVAEQVVAAWQGKLEQRWRTECARVKKANQRNETDLPCPSFDEFMSSHFPASVPFMSRGTEQNVPRETPSKGKGERKGQGQGDNSSDANASGAAAPVRDADQIFWTCAKDYLRPHVKGDPGSLVGRWCRDFGKTATASAITTAQLERPATPVPFIEASLRKRTNGSGGGEYELPIA